MSRAHSNFVRMLASVLAACSASTALAQSTRVWTDPAADTVLRRTDVGNSADPLANAVRPDLLSVTIGGWSTSTPVSDPFSRTTGAFVAAAGAHMLRLDVVFAGLVNPPGPISVSSSFHFPQQFGPSPLYAYIDFDVDNDFNTGGEASLTDTCLAQAARFGARPQALASRAITGVTDYEADCFTEPYFRRTGAEFALSLCGCFEPSLISQTGNMNGLMDAGETFVIRGPFFLRTSGYQDASLSFGGNFPGTYDPQINLQFKHSTSDNNTTVSLVFPLTMHGYALLNGLQTDPPANHNVSDAFSVYEALRDVIVFCNTQNVSGCAYPIAQGWTGRDANNYLNVTTWRANALVGTTYAAPPQSGFYVWTDIGFDALYKDVNGDGLITAADRAAVIEYINRYDGDGFEDADFTVNGSVQIRMFAFYYSTFDINYDGFVDSNDLSMFPSTCRVNWDGIGGVNSDDFFAFINDFFQLQADFNLDGATNSADFFAFMNEFFMGCP